MSRFVGIDVGAEAIKVVEITTDDGAPRWTRRQVADHDKEPAAALLALLADWDWPGIDGAAVTGRFSRLVRLDRVPTKQAQSLGFRFIGDDQPATLVSIGGHGFSVLELRESGLEVFRENSRCSQGTGNFLRQLVARFDMDIDAASALCADVADPAPLSGRCPVILKTDMTHLANKGESRARILAGLYDAVCENVQVLIKPRLSPSRLMLVGGVQRARRVHDNFRRFAAKHEMTLLDGGDDALFLEALGCATLAARGASPRGVPALAELVAPTAGGRVDEFPALRGFLDRVTRMTRPAPTAGPASAAVILGFDIGSTGSKIVALDADTQAIVWSDYVSTNGNPVGAAQQLMQLFVDGPAGQLPVRACGATGSGREIVGSLLTTCYGPGAVFVLNEIAAHAEGALHYDRGVDTIFEIGGQDAKYIRLAGGRVVDAAMNEACSAGTGSFIEEQGRKFAGVRDVAHLGQEALRADTGVSLGQHCSVFMAEVIDEAVAAGVPNPTIIAGIYDSIIQNYLNRVKGSRSVGQRIFCQGMPFSADALAAAVARQTGSNVVVPPDPGTVGALGIALLTVRSLAEYGAAPEALDPRRFLAAHLDKKETFICKSTKGCGGAGNKCRIDRITTTVEEAKLRFTWGGACSLWDKGATRRKLPDLAPDPFREREELIAGLREALAGRQSQRPARKLVGITDEFQLKGLFPFFSTFLVELGFDLDYVGGADQATLKRGVEGANVPFCAPMQMYHGVVSALAGTAADVLFMPMILDMPRVGDEKYGALCPIVQGSTDMLRHDLGAETARRVVSPVIDFGVEGIDGPRCFDSCQRIAEALGAPAAECRAAYESAVVAQAQFEARCRELGRDALDFSAAHGIIPIVVLGRPYTIYNKVLNSNVPAILREQGAIAIPIDCYPIAAETPVYHDIYWGHSQRNLRAAQQVRSTPGVYSLWCSNYACGPDSFNLHFYSYLMDGKPFAVIETDGHSGDAGTKTRVEAFLHCVRGDLARDANGDSTARPGGSLKDIEADKTTLLAIKARGERVLIPRMGVGAEVVAACFRGVGIAAEALPEPTRETVRIGRRYTSGKECVPMCVTVGSVLQRVAPAAGSPHVNGQGNGNGHKDPAGLTLMMPMACGPCRFGVYHVLHKIILERLGQSANVRVWSPGFGHYFDGVPGGLSMALFTGFVTADLLLEAFYEARPDEKQPGTAQAIFDRYYAELLAKLEAAGHDDLSTGAALLQFASGRLFGCMNILERAAAEFKACRDPLASPRPTILVVGEGYVRCDPFTNDYIVDKLEARGVRVRFAPFTEWLEYSDLMSRRSGESAGFGAALSSFIQNQIHERLYANFGKRLGWHPRTRAAETLRSAAPYVRDALECEAVLTVGAPLHEWHEGLIDGVVSVGPHECMPNKISEAQFFHVAEKEGLASLVVPLTGDPIDPEILDNFVFEVRSRYEAGAGVGGHQRARRRPLPTM
jgi:predicted CoA-substrate-specific enzyme activase